ncbi:MAG: DUF1365 domain-containing protein [Thiohalospira sp.]
MSAPDRILHSRVMHRRSGAVRYRFVYRIFSLLVDIDGLDELDHGLRLFGHNRLRLLSLYDRDFGPGDGSPLRPWLEGHLADHGIDLEGGPIRLLAMPRVLGYQFNPLSVWYAYHRDGTLRAVLGEVHNTFGDRHGYLLHDEGRPLPDPVRQSKVKVFHVSPFIGMDCEYHFRLTHPGDEVAVVIRQTEGGEHRLTATQTGTTEPLTDRRLAAAALRLPLVTLKVITLIHWWALRIGWSGGRFHRRPKPPEKEVT